VWALTSCISARAESGYFTTGGLPPIISSWRPDPWDSRPVDFYFYLNTCDHSPYVTSSLTTGWVCRLQLLLTLTSAVILRSVSRGTHDQILLSQIRDSPNLEGQPTGTGWPGYTPKHWVPFLSLPTTRRAMVEVFGSDSDSKRGSGTAQLFRRMYTFHFDGRWVNEASNEQKQAVNSASIH
jgi:hypothetical protein